MTILSDAARSRGRGIDGRGASRANAPGSVEATGGDTTLLKVEGHFNVTGPLETFANAGGVHLARAILAEFAENVAKLVAEQAQAAAPRPDPLTAAENREKASPRRDDYQAVTPALSELKGNKILWRCFEDAARSPAAAHQLMQPLLNVRRLVQYPEGTFAPRQNTT